MSSTEQPTEQNISESLSALMDGEASDIEIRRVLKCEDADLSRRWQRYHLASAAMRRDSDSGFGSMALSASVSAAIAREPSFGSAAKAGSKVSPATAKSTMVHLWSSLGRVAVAASVAGAVVIGVQLSPGDVTNSLAATPETPITLASGQPVLGTDTAVRAVGTRVQPPIVVNYATQQHVDAMKREVNRLMLEHAENSSQNTQNSVTPFAKVPDDQ